jgi:outer membrane protein TolC
MRDAASRAACLALIGALALTAACVRFHPEPISPERSADQLQARTLDDAGLRSYLEATTGHPLETWPLPSWDLSSLTLAAFYYQPDLDVARAQLAVADAGTRTSGERPNPSIGLTPGYNVTTRTPSPWIPTAVLDMTIETVGKRGHRRAEARHLSEAARLTLASVAWQVRGRVRAGLVALHSARGTAALLQEQQALRDELVRLMGVQYQAGALSGFDLRLARIAADQTRLSRHDAERQLLEARVALAGAVGVPVSALERVEFSSAGLDSAPLPEELQDARRQALVSRADLLSALAEYAASQSALQLEIAKQYPDLQIGPGYEYDQGDDKWSLGVTLSLPIFSRNRGPIAEAQARRRQAAARFEALQARVLAEVDRALGGYTAARRQQADAEALQAELVRQQEVAVAKLEAGEIGKSELLGQQLELCLSKLARQEALTRSLEALAALEDALQRPLGVPASSWEEPPRPASMTPEGQTP